VHNTRRDSDCPWFRGFWPRPLVSRVMVLASDLVSSTTGLIKKPLRYAVFDWSAVIDNYAIQIDSIIKN